MSDVRAALARQAHRLAGEAESAAALHRADRNRLIRELRREDPTRWSYQALASAVGCNKEMIAAILQGRVK